MHTVPFESIIFGGGIVESVQKSPTKIFLPAELQQRLEHFGCGTEFSPPPIIVILYHEDRSIIEIKKTVKFNFMLFNVSLSSRKVPQKYTYKTSSMERHCNINKIID